MHTPRTMITFNEHGTRFTYRVGGILIHHDRVLLQYADGADPFWFLPGGRAELYESAEETLKREMQEELGIEIQIERLLYVLENFFVSQGTPEHELGLYFLMTLPTGSYVYEQSERFQREEEGRPITFAWQSLDTLAHLPLYPTFFCDALRSLPSQTTHSIHIDKSVPKLPSPHSSE